MRFRITALFIVIAALLGVSASAAQAVMPHGNATMPRAVMPHGTMPRIQQPATMPRVEVQKPATITSIGVNQVANIALATCPSSDGNVSWGDAKMCDDPTGVRFHLRDKVTDGHCVRIKYYSEDRSEWTNEGPQACTTGQWITWASGNTGTARFCNPTARLYRSDGAYFMTVPSTVC